MISKWEEEQERIAARNAKKIIHPTMVRTGNGIYDLEFNGGHIQLSRDNDGKWTFWAVVLESEEYGRLSLGGAVGRVSELASASLERVRKGLDEED